MAVEIRPEPTPEEREAILRVLADLDGGGEPRSAWWDAGLHEALEDAEIDGELP